MTVRSAALIVVALLTLTGVATAQYVQPPAYRGEEGATQQSWLFSTPAQVLGPDGIDDNPYGAASLVVYGAADISHRWSEGRWYGEGLTMDLSVPLGPLWDGGLIDTGTSSPVGESGDGLEADFRIEIDYYVNVVSPTVAPRISVGDNMMGGGDISGELLFSGILRIDRWHYKLVQDYSSILPDGWAGCNPGFYPGHLDVTIETPAEWGESVGGYHTYGAIDTVTVDTFVIANCGSYCPWYGPVTLDDFVTLKNNFGRDDVMGWCQGDWDVDGDVDLDDFVLLKRNFGNPFGATAPEPTTLCLLAIGAAAILRRRRR